MCMVPPRVGDAQLARVVPNEQFHSSLFLVRRRNGQHVMISIRGRLEKIVNISVTAGSQMACADHVEECTRTLEDECEEPQKHNRGITGQGLRPLLALSRARLNGFSTVWSTRNTKKHFGV